MNSGEQSAHPADWGWEQRLIKDYYNHRWTGALEPLCDWLQRWKNGTLAHDEMEQVLEQTHEQICEIRSLFNQRDDRLSLLIQWMERDWFEEWVREHTPPPGVNLVPPGP